MDRRSILKQLGAIGGTSTLSKVDSDLWEIADRNTLVKSKAVFSELSFAVTNEERSFPLTAACRIFPAHTFESQKKERVFINKTKNTGVNVEEDDLVVTHQGLESGNRGTLQFRSMPVSATVGGSSTVISGSDNQHVEIDRQDENRFSFSFGERDVTVEKNETATAKTSTTIKYGSERERTAEVDIEIHASHQGSVSIVSHPHHYVFPKTEAWGRALEHSLGTGEGIVSQVKAHNDAYEVIPTGREN